MSKKLSRKKTKTIEVTCQECDRVVRVSEGSMCAMNKLCYSCISKKGKKDE